MHCSVFFAFDNGVITLLVQMRALNFTDKYPSPCSPSLKPGKKRENCDEQKFICIRKLQVRAWKPET